LTAQKICDILLKNTENKCFSKKETEKKINTKAKIGTKEKSFQFYPLKRVRFQKIKNLSCRF